MQCAAMTRLGKSQYNAKQSKYNRPKTYKYVENNVP